MQTNRLICFGIFMAMMSCAMGVTSAGAQEKASMFGWWPGHWTWTKYQTFNPYLETGKDTQNQQWAAEDWYVQDWVSQSKSGATLVNGFFRADILREQDDDAGVPVIYVGPQFYRLGGFDKRRVMTTLDEVYGITKSGEQRLIKVRDWNTKRDIGIFTKDGLQLE